LLSPTSSSQFYSLKQHQANHVFLTKFWYILHYGHNCPSTIGRQLVCISFWLIPCFFELSLGEHAFLEGSEFFTIHLNLECSVWKVILQLWSDQCKNPGGLLFSLTWTSLSY
jgi:hypothetical protein